MGTEFVSADDDEMAQMRKLTKCFGENLMKDAFVARWCYEWGKKTMIRFNNDNREQISSSAMKTTWISYGLEKAKNVKCIAIVDNCKC